MIIHLFRINQHQQTMSYINLIISHKLQEAYTNKKSQECMKHLIVLKNN